MSAALIDALDAHDGIVCAVGAGGKKTTLYALAMAHPGRVGYTATVFAARFPRRLQAHALVTDRADLPAALASARAHDRVAYARPTEKPGRVAGVAPELIAECHRQGAFDLTLVKADGARMRAIKAPAEDEPVIPAGARTVLILVSAAAIGQPLDERIAHRPERITAVTGLQAGEAITPEAVGRLLAAETGGLQGVPAGATAIGVINAVDDPARRTAAERAARIALAASGRLARVVLTSHHDGSEPLVARVDRA